MDLDWGKAPVVIAASLFVAAAVGAGIYSKHLAKVGDFESEAGTELVRFARGMLKCGRQLPDTGPMVPESFESVSGKTYESTEEDWDSKTFICSNFSIEGPQRLQYGWIKEQDGKGFVTARADVDADGAPDKWFEIPVVCPASGCVTVNYVYEVDQDGVRQPPMLLGVLGRADAYLGEPPSLSPESPTPVQSESNVVEVADTKLAPPPKLPAAGLPIALDTLYFEGERRATSKQWGVALVLLEYEAVRGRQADPKQGAVMRAHYGVPDATGRVAKNAATIVATFDAGGLGVADGRAPRSLKVLGLECLPEQVLAATRLPMPLSMSLEWDTEMDRSLWSIKGEGSTNVEHFSANNCAHVDATAAHPH